MPNWNCAKNSYNLSEELMIGLVLNEYKNKTKKGFISCYCKANISTKYDFEFSNGVKICQIWL